MYTSTSLSLSLYIYIYTRIYVYIYIERERRRERCPIGANCCTPEIIQVKFHWKPSLKVHWTFPVNIHWESGNPTETTADKKFDPKP